MLALSPKLMSLEFENVTADKLLEVVPALILILEIVAAFDAMAVVRKAGTPRLSPEVLSVPTMAVPAVVVEVNPVPAYVVAMLAATCPAVFVKLTPFAFEKERVENVLDPPPAENA